MDNQDSLGSWALLDTGANRWRPLTNLLLSLVFFTGRNDYSSWWLANAILLTALGVVVGALILNITKSLTLTISLVLIFQTSRFLQYNLTNAFGLMETLALLLLALLIWSMRLATLRKDPRIHFAIPALFLAISLTHERFQSLAPALLLFVWLQADLTAKLKVVLGVLISTPVLFISFMKTYAFGIPLAVGTGSATEVGFTPESTLQHVLALILNLLGINYGEHYLNGLIYDFQDQNQKSLTSLVVIGTVGAIAATVFASKLSVKGSSEQNSWHPKVLTLMLLMLTGPILITIRLEPRWISSVFMVMLVFLAFSWTNSNLAISRGWKIFVTCVAFVHVLANSMYWQSFDNSYIREPQIRAAAHLETAYPLWQQANNQNLDIYVVSPDDPVAVANYLNLLVKSNYGLVVRSVTGITAEEQAELSDKPLFVVSFDPSTGQTVSVGQR
jgi:hypothetical protein